MSRYRCRVHPDEPVTFKGTGCLWCAEQTQRHRRTEDGDPSTGHGVHWQRKR